MARKDIGRVLSGVAISLCTILLFTVDSSGQFEGKPVMRTISGNAGGQAGVTMKGFPGEAVVTDDSGNYNAKVTYGWNGTVTPAKLGFTFEPVSIPYTKVTENKANQDYKATQITFTISGTTGLAGVELQGLPDKPVTGLGGAYSVKVPYGFTATVTPVKAGYIFTPQSRPYASVTSDQSNQTYTAAIMTFVISGTTGVDGAVMKGFPGDPICGPDGSYKATVLYNFSGTVTPTKTGYTFNPPKMDYPEVTAAMADQNYTATLITFTVSGKIGVEGVTMSGLPGNPVTGADGLYTTTVPYGWSATVVPAKDGYTFVPQRKPYMAVTADQANHDYVATPITFTISGKTNVPGAVMRGLPGDPPTDATGGYKAVVPWGWMGTATPEKEGHVFSPESKPYPKVAADQVDQNYTAVRIKFAISGTTMLAGVVLKGLPGDPTSGKDGTYSVSVDYGWSGKVVPYREGYTFDPPNREYKDLNGARSEQDFTAALMKLTITGKIELQGKPVPDVSILASGGITGVTGPDGIYTLQVDYGWKGTVAAMKEGYIFNPPSRKYDLVIAKDQTAQGFIATLQMFTISGTMKVGGVPIEGVAVTASNGGTSTVTTADGKYSVSVPYGWSGDITPTKEGFEFEPPSIKFTDVKTNYKDGEPEAVKPPAQPVVTEQPPVTKPLEKPPDETGAPPREITQAPPKVEPNAVEPVTGKDKQIEDLQKKLAHLMGQPITTQPTVGKEREPVQPIISRFPGDLETRYPGEWIGGTRTPRVGSLVTAVFVGNDIREVLAEIARQTGVDIYADDTVKDAVVTCSIRQLPVEMALQEVLKGTKYAIKRIPHSYLVYLPISNVFVDTEVREALLNIGTAAGIVIIPDESVTGMVTCELKAVPLDTALEMVLVGTTYVVKKTPYYYLVTAGDMKSASFPAVSETRRLKLNYIRADRAVALLSTVFRAYAQAETDGYKVLITAPPGLADRIATDLQKLDRAPRHVMLDARIVTMERGNLLNLGVEWGWPKLRAGAFSDSLQHGIEARTEEGILPTAWPWGVQIGYATDRSFTDSLLLALNLLRENGEADIVASPQVLAQDGKPAEIRAITEEYYMMTPSSSGQGNLFAFGQSQLETVQSGTSLVITPNIGDNNDITLEISVEVSDSIPRGRGSDLPVVTRRTAKNVVCIKDGGTVALAGLTENRSRLKEKRVPGLGDLPFVGALFTNTETDKVSREVAVFVTAYLVSEGGQPPSQLEVESAHGGAAAAAAQPEQTGEQFKQLLKESLSRQPR